MKPGSQSRTYIYELVASSLGDHAFIRTFFIQQSELCTHQITNMEWQLRDINIYIIFLRILVPTLGKIEKLYTIIRSGLFKAADYYDQQIQDQFCNSKTKLKEHYSRKITSIYFPWVLPRVNHPFNIIHSNCLL